MQGINEELELLEENGQFRRIPPIVSKSDGKLLLGDKEYVNFASNDYLGVSTKQELIEEFIDSHQQLPLFSSASARLLTGTS